ncbi:putative HEPN domain protein [Candidatus Methylomirabilis oxygeniifera]|uniref:Putative HEPN domain protein n=1 Tax=Methylomirabilis oxygeniifera TaxID=671143 RepID=D5MM90_METO1|nr:putative HEPN domain protein [Candidatus Methylomirabilis oxyfera]
MRRAPREEGARWLQQAVEDLRWAEDLAERGGSYRLLPGPADRRKGPQGVPYGYYIPTRYPNSIPDSIPAHIFTRDAAGE